MLTILTPSASLVPTLLSRQSSFQIAFLLLLCLFKSFLNLDSACERQKVTFVFLGLDYSTDLRLIHFPAWDTLSFLVYGPQFLYSVIC